MSTQCKKAEESSLFRDLTPSFYVFFYVIFFFNTNEDVTTNNWLQKFVNFLGKLLDGVSFSTIASYGA